MDQVRFELFRRWPDAMSMSRANPVEVERVIRSLGLGTRRAHSLVRMSKEFLEKEWTDPLELWSLGRYASDAYRMFVLRKKVKDPADKFLKVYDKWWRTGKIEDWAYAESRTFNTDI